jgi:hypothetical protein
MKRLLILLALTCIFQFTKAQTSVLDNEKLLDYYQTQRYSQGKRIIN